MSDTTFKEGKNHYKENLTNNDVLAWYERQWKQWPTRVDKDKTTNISFLYGASVAYREEHGRDPEMSNDFKGVISHLKSLEDDA